MIALPFRHNWQSSYSYKEHSLLRSDYNNFHYVQLEFLVVHALKYLPGYGL